MVKRDSPLFPINGKRGLSLFTIDACLSVWYDNSDRFLEGFKRFSFKRKLKIRRSFEPYRSGS